jgi:hypothetical protein
MKSTANIATARHFFHLQIRISDLERNEIPLFFWNLTVFVPTGTFNYFHQFLPIGLVGTGTVPTQ